MKELPHVAGRRSISRLSWFHQKAIKKGKSKCKNGMHYQPLPSTIQVFEITMVATFLKGVSKIFLNLGNRLEIVRDLKPLHICQG